MRASAHMPRASASRSQACATGRTSPPSRMSSPVVGIVVGSESDRERMQPAICELEVRSAHRQPDAVAEYGRAARERGLRVLIAGAGLAAALPGVLAAHTDLPVIAQMPPGVPVACVGVDSAKNAAVLAARILGPPA